MPHFADGFNGRLLPGRRPAVLAIDMMRAYFDPESPLCLPSNAWLNPASRVIAEARSRRVPVIHTRVEYGPEGLDGGLFMRKVKALELLVRPTELGEFMPSVAPAQDELVVVKQYASAFFGTSLSSTLQSAGIDTLVILGTSTSGCIRASAVDAVQHGFIPLVVRDGVRDRDDQSHEANYDLQAKYAEVITEAEALSYLKEER